MPNVQALPTQGCRTAAHSKGYHGPENQLLLVNAAMKL